MIAYWAVSVKIHVFLILTSDKFERSVLHTRRKGSQISLFKGGGLATKINLDMKEKGKVSVLFGNWSFVFHSLS